MAEVYDFPNGEQLERLIARHKTVQRKLDREIRAGYIRAKDNLESYPENRTGNAQVSIEQGDIDRYLVLEDPYEDGKPGFAMIIELGRPEGKNGSMEGLFIISDAMRLPRREARASRGDDLSGGA